MSKEPKKEIEKLKELLEFFATHRIEEFIKPEYLTPPPSSEGKECCRKCFDTKELGITFCLNPDCECHKAPQGTSSEEEGKEKSTATDLAYWIDRRDAYGEMLYDPPNEGDAYYFREQRDEAQKHINELSPQGKGTEGKKENLWCDRAGGGKDCKCICHQESYPLPEDFPKGKPDSLDWEVRQEINTRLYYALGDISPTSLKMGRAVESIYEFLKEKQTQTQEELGKKIIEGLEKLTKVLDDHKHLFPCAYGETEGWNDAIDEAIKVIRDITK